MFILSYRIIIKPEFLKKIPTQLFLFFIFSLLLQNVNAQNCTVNAGIDKSVCAGSTEIQEGNIGGNFQSNTVLWTQVSGPAAATITNNTSLSPTISNLIAGTYVFQIQATCQIGGNAIDQVTYTVKAAATPVAPSNMVIGCYTPGTAINLSGTAPPGHTLTWSVVSSNTPSAGTFNGATQTTFTGNNPTIQFAAPPLSWCATGGSNTVINVKSTNSSTGCSIDRTFFVFYTIKPSAISAYANPAQVCGTCTNLIGSCQQSGTGLWTVVSAPGGAPAVTFSPNSGSAVVNACNLIPGNYTFRWTVSGGACTTGFADVNVTVAPPASLTSPIANSKRFCPGTLPSTISLEGNVPSGSETVSWSQVSGPAVTITNANSPHAQAAGLTEGGAPYIFKYTISNGGCSVSDTMMISVTRPIGYQPTQAGNCLYSNQSYISRNIGSIPFMHADSIPVSIIYESGPALNMQVMYQATMYTVNGGSTGVDYYSPAINITRGGTATYTYLASNLWPNYNQYSASITFWFYTNNNIPSCFNILPGIYRFRLRYKDDCGTYTSEPFETRVASVGAFNAGSDQMLPCGFTTTTLAGNAQRCEVVPFWTTIKKPAAAADPINAGNMYSTNAALSGLQNGSYIFVWGSNASGWGCPVNSDSVRITVSVTPPAIPLITGGGSYCISTPVKISGQLNDDAASGTWTVTSSPLGGTYTLTPSVNSPNIVFTPATANTTYTLTWTVVNGCGNAAAFTTVTTGSSTAVIPDITTASNCFSYTTLAFGTLNATPAGGVWSSSNPNYTLTTPNNISTGVSPTAFSTSLGSVVFYYTLSGACGSLKDSVSFGPFQNPSLPTGNFCSIASFPTTQTLTLTNILPYAVYDINGISGPGTATVTPMTFIPTSTTQNLSFTASQSGQYAVNISQRTGSCMTTTSYTIQLSSLPLLAIAGPDINLCGATNTVALNALPNPLGSSGGTWSVQNVYNGFGPTFSNAASPISNAVFNNGGGDVLLKWSVTGDNPFCNGATQDYLRIRYVPAANAGQDDFTCYDATLSPASMVLSANKFTAGVGSWSIISKPAAANPSFINSSLPNTTIVGLLNGQYQLRWTITDPLGTCPATSDDVYLTVYYGCYQLPVKLLDFFAQINNKDVLLKWIVDNEDIDNLYYIERSMTMNGPFATIGLVKFDASKNGNYNLNDADALLSGSRYLYYRIKMLDKQNKVSYSKILKVKTGEESTALNVYPTLVKRGEPVNIVHGNNTTAVFSCELVSANGQVVKKYAAVNSGSFKINTTDIVPGIYILQIYYKDNSFNYKILVQ